MSRKFTVVDEPFKCSVCGNYVDRLYYSSRDHCPYCLSSIHVDIYPGDRSCECRGVLAPIGIENSKKTYKIVYKCSTCGEIKRNTIADDDNMELIISLSSIPLARISTARVSKR